MNLSVIIPCYNCVTTLEATVHSIQDSGLTDYELLLIDDGSTDGTAELCDRLCAHDPAIHCTHQENAGVSAARNSGINKAQGDYIWFVDADDTVDAGALAHAAQLATAQAPDMLIFGMSFDYYHRGKRYRQEILLPPYSGMLSLEQFKGRFQEFYAYNALTSACNKFVRRDLLTVHGVRFHEDMILMEDFLFVLESLPFCRNIYCLPEDIYHYRQAEDEKGAYRRLRRIPDLAAYMQPFDNQLRSLGIPDSLCGELYQMLLWQKMYDASLGEIKLVLAKHSVGCYGERYPQHSALAIFLENKKTQLRHWIAVMVKSSTLYQKNRTGKQRQ